MYHTALPDHTLPGFDERRHFSRFGNTNIIFNANSSKAHCDNHVGCLSLKTVLSGEEWYSMEGRSVAVKPGTFLILNHGQDYSCRIDAPAKTISVFFAKEFAKTVLRDLVKSTEAVTDDPFQTGDDLPEFFQVLHQFDDSIKRDLLQLIHALEAYGYQSNLVDEHIVFLLNGILKTHQKDIKSSKRIHAMKASTRKEVYKRVCVARDVLHTHYHKNPSLKQVALASSLSVPQLVRQFHAAFGVTPHRYMSDERLKEAARLLLSTETPVVEIAASCGFEDMSTFVRAFKHKYNVSAVGYRRNIKPGGK